ncbi:MAG: hypothetical protein M3069_33370 [Chloroflexota bacterium]|nr:hypothetical protein [Chloroflexota bacterium]
MSASPRRASVEDAPVIAACVRPGYAKWARGYVQAERRAVDGRDTICMRKSLEER